MADGPESDPQRALRALRAERDAWAQELFETNRHAAELAIARQTLVDALDAADARALARARAEILPELEAIRRERDAACAARDHAQRRARDAEARLHRIASSTSWRITFPLRAALATLLGRPRSGL